MAFGLKTDEVVSILTQEVNKQTPPEIEPESHREFRLIVRRQVAEIEAAGGVVDIPFDPPDPGGTPD
jgi:hypothetical protein